MPINAIPYQNVILVPMCRQLLGNKSYLFFCSLELEFNFV